MSPLETKPSLEQLAEGAAKDVREQQARAAAEAARQAAPQRGKRMLAGALAVACVGLLVVQAPRMSAPFAWPDPDRDPVVADADLETVVSLIETHRAARGNLPATLDDVRLPPGLAEVVAKSQLAYKASDSGYALDWTLPHWHATYASDTDKVSVQPRAKP